MTLLSKDLNTYLHPVGGEGDGDVEEREVRVVQAGARGQTQRQAAGLHARERESGR